MLERAKIQQTHKALMAEAQEQVATARELRHELINNWTVQKLLIEYFYLNLREREKQKSIDNQ